MRKREREKKRASERASDTAGSGTRQAIRECSMDYRVGRAKTAAVEATFLVLQGRNLANGIWVGAVAHLGRREGKADTKVLQIVPERNGAFPTQT